MTADEIKNRVSILEVASMYGVRPDKKGFCHCCFPGHAGSDRGASLKLYQDQNSFYCYGCGRQGDIFSFVQMMEGCDFKEAFKKLGGSYQKPTAASKIRLYKMKHAKNKKLENEQRFRAMLDRNSYLLGLYRATLEKLTPMTEVWAYTLNKLEYQKYLNWFYIEHWDELREGVHIDGFEFN